MRYEDYDESDGISEERMRRHRRYKSTRSAKRRKLKDFGFNARSSSGSELLKGFGEIYLESSEEDVERLFACFFEGENYHLWMDNSALDGDKIIRLYGKREKETYRIKSSSFIYSCGSGLVEVDDEYDLMLRRIKSISGRFNESLESMLRKDMNLSIPDEVINEYSKGLDYLQERIGRSRNVMYSNEISEKVRVKRNLAKMMLERNKRDDVLHQLRENSVFIDTLESCIEFSEKERMGTSETNNILIALAIANAVISSEQIQKLATADGGFISLLNRMRGVNRHKVKFEVKEGPEIYVIGIKAA